MTYNEVYGIIASTDEKCSNVVITTKESKKQYKQNLYISSANLLKIRGYANTKIVGYNVTDTMTYKWENIRLIKKRVKSKKTNKMKKKTYHRVGYYNSVDAVMMYDISADEIIHNMNKRLGHFYFDDEDGNGCNTTYSEEEILKSNDVKATTDGRYLVICDNCSDFDNIPIDLVQDLAKDRFIEVFEVD